VKERDKPGSPTIPLPADVIARSWMNGPAISLFPRPRPSIPSWRPLFPPGFMQQAQPLHASIPRSLCARLRYLVSGQSRHLPQPAVSLPSHGFNRRVGIFSKPMTTMHLRHEGKWTVAPDGEFVEYCSSRAARAQGQLGAAYARDHRDHCPFRNPDWVDGDRSAAIERGLDPLRPAAAVARGDRRAQSARGSNSRPHEQAVASI